MVIAGSEETDGELRLPDPYSVCPKDKVKDATVYMFDLE